MPIVMGATGLKRWIKVIATGAPLSVQIGGATLGQIFNVFRESIDNLGHVSCRYSAQHLVSVFIFIFSFSIGQGNNLVIVCHCFEVVERWSNKFELDYP